MPTDAAARKEMAQASVVTREHAACSSVPFLEGSPWQRIKGAGEGSTADGDGSAHWSGLEVPEARNHRFCVHSLQEFREQIFRPPPIDG